MSARPIPELIDAHAAALVLYARQWCDAPEDAVQEAFCKLVALPTPPDDAAAWLFRAVRNAAIDSGRSARRRHKREASVARPDRWFAECDGPDSEQAAEALKSLDGDLREVIVARLWGGMSLEQIAGIVGCSVSTVHRRFEAGIAILRERLGVECPKTN